MDLIASLTKAFNNTPDKKAIIGPKETLTYKKLDKLTQKVSGYLLSLGVMKEDVIAIECDDRFETICLLIGVVRSGAAFCVIPNTYPEHRKEQMRKKVNVKWTLRNLESIPEDAYSPVIAERDNSSLLYIIFTSGSTGEPKAVAIEDRSIQKIVNTNDFYEGEVIAQLAPIEFDASIYEIFGGLLNGLTLRLISKDDSLDPQVMSDIFNEIDMMFLTTRLFNLYVDEIGEELQKVSLILTGGERCSVRHLTAAAKYCTVLHVYGPSETTVFATKYEVAGDETEIPIGQIFDQGSYLILDEGNQAAEGEQGELCISDSGLMRGYVGDDQASQNVFFTWQGNRYYRTGDIVYVNSGGQIMYVERKDRQVKVSGYRIELSEIEKCASEYGLQKDCLAHYDGTRLYLYIQDQVELNDFRQFLKQRLPEYMVPTVKLVSSIPMKANGKTDIGAIKETPLEDKLAYEFQEAFEEVLDRGVSKDQTFLELGGDSIKAMEIIWIMGEKGYNLDLNMLFSKTMGEIMENVRNS
ncbi:non-ribosomal peptide synthetase [Actinomycetes bacterium NPDC127524]